VPAARGSAGVLTHIAIRKSGIAADARIARRRRLPLLTLRLPADAMTLPSPLPVSGPLRVKELNPAQVTAILGNDPRLIIPIGTCEQHGPHLPLGCDTIIVEHMCDDLSAEYGVLRAPTVEYGVNVDTERGFTGNASLRKKTLHRMLNDLIDSWEATGVREFILVTAHGHDPHQEALATVITTAARVRVVDIFGVNLSDLLQGQREAMHGDEVDTSIMLFLRPELVNLDLAQDYMMSREQLRRYRRGWLTVPSGSAGSIGRPSLASADKGKRLYERIFAKISDRIFLAPAPAE
jgi:creatinine amidohydrolase